MFGSEDDSFRSYRRGEINQMSVTRHENLLASGERTMSLSQLTALKKPNGRVCGICAGDTFRRLVAKCLARQHQRQLQAAVAPANFGLADRSGTDGLVHLIRAATEADAECTLLSIDGVGAYDHVSRATMLEQLWREPELRCLVPFVRL